MKKSIIFIGLLVLSVTLFYAGDVNVSVLGGGAGGAFSSGFTAGATVSLPLTANLAIEGECFYYPKPMETTSIIEEEICPSGEHGVHFTDTKETSGTGMNFNTSLIYRFQVGNRRFVPYLAAGIGLLNVRTKTAIVNNNHPTSSVQDDGGFNFAAGGGFEYVLGKRMGLRLDARYIKSFGDLDNNVLRFATGLFIDL